MPPARLPGLGLEDQRHSGRPACPPHHRRGIGRRHPRALSAHASGQKEEGGKNLEKWKWIDSKPAKINRTKKQAGRIRYLTDEQAACLLDAAKQDQSPEIYPYHCHDYTKITPAIKKACPETRANLCFFMVPKGGIEPQTRGFSVLSQATIPGFTELN
jgi:hypothetical protein